VTRVGGPPAEVAGPDPVGDPPGRFEPLAAKIDTQVARRHSRLREWTPYRHYHRLMKRLDSLPAEFGVGYDFEFWLRKAGSIPVDPDGDMMKK
jgi:hypothetical protein